MNTVQVCGAKLNVSRHSLPLTFSLTASLTAIVAESRATLAGHVQATLKTLNHMATIRTALPSLFDGEFFHPFCFFVLRTKLARMCF